MHRLVCLGDSLTQGFKSGAISEPGLSFPAIIAWEMGLAKEKFRYADFSGEGGLPVNIEHLLRRVDQQFGRQLSPWETPLAGIYLQRWMASAGYAASQCRAFREGIQARKSNAG